MVKQKWNIPTKAKDYKEVMNLILKQKNLPKENIRQFIDAEFKLNNPFDLENMDKAVEKIKYHIAQKNTICIVGDYDVDGITATAVMFSGLRDLGAEIFWILPHKVNDGYGMNNNIIDRACVKGAKLIITVDNGINAVEEIKYAKSIGIDVVVTDHHQPKEIVPDTIIVNPHLSKGYEFPNICGCMVALKVIEAIHDTIKEKALYRQLISIAAIGTIADVMPLINENRILVKHGLVYLHNTENVGIFSILEQLNLANKGLNVNDIGFYLAPCLNAAGRMDSPDISLKLILTEDYAEAKILAKKIIQLNNSRKEMQRSIIDKLQIDNNNPAIVAVVEEDAHGILGIVAGKIASTYKKPCFVLGSPNEDGSMGGSGRSAVGYNLCEIIEYTKGIVSGGGHPEAAGISLNVENLEKFKTMFFEHFLTWKQNCKEEVVSELNIVCEYDVENLNIAQRLYDNIIKLSPFGQGNEEPLLYMKQVSVETNKVVGKQKNVLKLKLFKNDNVLEAVAFGDMVNKYSEIGSPKFIDVVYQLSYNDWSNSIQLVIKDLKCS